MISFTPSLIWKGEILGDIVSQNMPSKTNYRTKIGNLGIIFLRRNNLKQWYQLLHPHIAGSMRSIFFFWATLYRYLVIQTFIMVYRCRFPPQPSSGPPMRFLGHPANNVWMGDYLVPQFGGSAFGHSDNVEIRQAVQFIGVIEPARILVLGIQLARNFLKYLLSWKRRWLCTEIWEWWMGSWDAFENLRQCLLSKSFRCTWPYFVFSVCEWPPNLCSFWH